MPLNDDLSRSRNDPNIIHPINRPLTVADLPSDMSTEQYWAAMREIEAHTERLLVERQGEAYQMDPFRMRISSLRRDDAEQIVNRIQEATGASHLLANNKGPVPFRGYYDAQGRPERSPATAFEFAPEAMSNPRAATLSQITERYDQGRSTLRAEQYFPSGTQYRPSVIQHNMDMLEGGIKTPGSKLIFDVETPGLNPDEGIWQLSARLMHEDNTFTDKTFYFDNPKMHLGVIGPEAQSVHDFLTPKGVSTDYVSNMKEFLNMSKEANFVGGHNIFFDYDMLSRSLKKHPAYTTDSDYSDLVDKFLNKFSDAKTGRIGNVVDTSILARMVMPNLSLAPELEGGPTPYRYSLQNILLQTDLVDKMQAAGAPVGDWFSGERGLHFADVDVPIESHLLTALQNHVSGEDRLQIGVNTPTGDAREAILRSRAIGPNIALSHEGQITGDLLARVGNDGLRDANGNIRFTPLEQMIVSQRNMENFIPNEYNVGEDTSLAERINKFSSLAGPESEYKILNQYGQVSPTGHMPSLSEWAGIQSQLAESGVPLSGMSFPERHISNLMNEISGPGTSAREARLRRTFGGDALGLNRFVQPENIQVVGKTSQIATIPLSYLKQWETQAKEAGQEVGTNFNGTGKQMFGLSPFSFTSENGSREIKEVGVMAQLNEEDLGSFHNWLMNHPDVAGNDELATRLSSAFDNNSGKYGIQVATLNGLGGGSEVNKLHGALRYYQGIGADKSDQTPMFHTAMAGEDITGAGDRSLYTAGAFIRPDLMTSAETQSLPGQIGKMVGDYKKINATERSAGTEHLFEGIKKTRRQDASALKWFKYQRKAFSGLPYAIGAAAIGGAGYYEEKKRKQAKIANQTYALMPYENKNWYEQNQQDSIPNNPNQPPNYLATAGVVGNLDKSKIRHTQMGSQRYNYLFNTGF